jgi:hypothetical protein
MSRAMCAFCQHDLQMAVGHLVGRRDTCPQCGGDLHSCKNCQFYEAKAYNECREPVAERVQDKDRANFCDQFVFQRGARELVSQQAQLRAAAEALFRKKSE